MYVSKHFFFTAEHDGNFGLVRCFGNERKKKKKRHCLTYGKWSERAARACDRSRDHGSDPTFLSTVAVGRLRPTRTVRITTSYY